jgi:hypothetical protein
MKSLIAKLSIAALGLSLAAMPMAASAAQVAVGVNVGGPCYGCGWHRPAPAPRPYWQHPYGWHPYGWRPAPVAYYDGYYGVAPGGFYGYYWHGGWYMHRRWSGGVWIYF